MNAAAIRWLRKWLIAVLLVALGGCVVPGYDYGEGYYGADQYYGGTSIGFGMSYYEPYGYDYGRWGPRYRVGPPPRGGRDRMSHPIPSIPSQPRGEHFHGGHGGGGNGGRHR